MSRLLTVAVTAMAAVPLVGSPAWAHNELRSATPAEDARLSAPPEQVVLRFAERLDPKFTTIAVSRADGSTIATGPLQVNGTQAVQPLTDAMPAGQYTVAYRVVSLDGHPVQGSLSFTVAATATPLNSPIVTQPPATSPSPDVPPSPAVAAGDDDSGTGGAGLTVVLAAAGAVLMAGLGMLLWRRRAARP
ncbi:copper resistance CopC family protein [Phytohabitans kaempferiae]|uniref:Copper resistance protein CopC n=1 Tax=Phytohabitans kaempferiae TaxID=1620943 RepID=A0ABV6MGV9_9ACTN